MVQQRSSESNSNSSSNSLPGERNTPVAAVTMSRKLSFRRKGNTNHIVSSTSNHSNARGVSSMDVHRSRSGTGSLAQDANLPVSSIPFKTSPPSTGNASASMQRKRDHSTSSFDAEGTAKLPSGTLAFLEYGEEVSINDCSIYCSLIIFPSSRTKSASQSHFTRESRVLARLGPVRLDEKRSFLFALGSRPTKSCAQEERKGMN
jgi:hypothetical protein